MSQQKWRLRSLWCLFVVAVVAMFARSWLSDVSGLGFAAVTLGSSLLSLLILVLAALLLRCRSCGHSLFWHAVSKHPVDRWMDWLLSVRECPQCGYTAQDPPTKSASP
jgi:hypothetical protein